MDHCTAPAGLRPVSGPAVWYGPEMARQTGWIRPLSAAEVAELETAVRQLDSTGIDIARIHPGDLAVPGLQSLVEVVRQAVLHGRGFSLLRGLPVERWTLRQCAIAYFGLGTLIGSRCRRTRCVPLSAPLDAGWE